jgi:uncharacterized metal-binding protein
MDASTDKTQSGKVQTKEFELITLEKTNKICGLCENFSSSKTKEKDLIAVMSCEGACLRGEVSRRVANKICFENSSANIARVCLGGAFTKDTGQRNMVRTAKRVIALEGCFIECASRMMRGVIPNLKPEVIFVDKHYSFNKNLFAINEVSEDELIKYSAEAAMNITKLVHL